jgi:glycosyltransferase involved in cell wall biosynthesis
MERHLRVLAITNLFPNDFEPQRGLFNYYQLRALRGRPEIEEVRVAAPVPVFPGMNLAPRLAASGRVQRIEGVHNYGGIEVDYPRYAYVPRVGRLFHGWMYYRGTRRAVKAIVESYRPDVLYATWSYPDGYAVSLLARDSDLPFVLKVHGTDINDYLGVKSRKGMILEALRRASTVVSVSAALSDVMVRHGIERKKIQVIYNGVDHDCFRRSSREEARGRLGIGADEKVALFVGNLKPVKGIDRLLDAWAGSGAGDGSKKLYLIGRGSLEEQLKKRTTANGVEDSVSFEGEKSPEEIAVWMNAADVLCLPSENEGVPNVILEAIACGLPVVASRVGGIPEIVDSDLLGELIEPGDVAGLGEALHRALTREWDRTQITAAAQRFSWSKNAKELSGVLAGAADRET